MPSHRTFEIKPIKEFLKTEFGNSYIDPFPYPFKQDAIEYLKSIPDDFVDQLVFDPSYSQRQLKEMYKSSGLSFNYPMNNAYWSVCKKQIGRVVKNGGRVMSFGWNTGGIGIKHGFKILKILLVPHGSQHNDTIVTLEIKND